MKKVILISCVAIVIVAVVTVLTLTTFKHNANKSVTTNPQTAQQLSQAAAKKMSDGVSAADGGETKDALSAFQAAYDAYKQAGDAAGMANAQQSINIEVANLKAEQEAPKPSKIYESPKQ